MGKITREYLEKIDFVIDAAKDIDRFGGAFSWSATHQGQSFWIHAVKRIERGELPGVAKAIVDEMIRVWNESEAQPDQPEPSIEYVITAGPGRMIDLGVTTEFYSKMEYQLHHKENWEISGAAIPEYHAVATTTACMTGK